MRITDLTELRSFVRLVEFFPPSSTIDPQGGASFDVRTRIQSLMEKARRVESLSDAVIIAQPKDATRFQIPSLMAAVEVKKGTGIEAVPTIPLRDYNKNALRGLILYGLFAGLENFCLVRGDPFLQRELDYSSNVYDLKKVAEAAKLTRQVVDSVYGTRASILGPIDISGRNGELDDDYVQMIVEREESGVDVFICQPFFGDVEDCLERIDRLRAASVSHPIIHNVFPLRGEDDAMKMEGKFGWRVGKELRRVLREGGLRAGLKLARERYLSLVENRGKIDGVYISSRGNADWALAILT